MTKAEMKLGALVQNLDMHLDDDKEAIRKFAAELVENPMRAFEWASGKIKIAGEIEVYTEAIQWLTQPINGQDKSAADRLNYLKGLAQGRALDGAESPKESTSMVSVLTSNAVTAAWARLAQQLNRMDWAE